jgi:hypothetical protein
MLVTVTAKCSVLIIVTVTLQCSVLLVVTVTEVFNDSYGHCHFAIFSAPYVQSSYEVFSAPYGYCHSTPYHRSAVVMNVLSPRTASRQNDEAASHSCHFTTVLYPRSYSQCQLPVTCSRRDIRFTAPSAQNFRAKFSQSQHYVHCTSADLLRCSI